MSVMISCVFLFELLGFMLAIVCAHVWFMQICVNVLLNNLATLRMSLATMFMLTILPKLHFQVISELVLTLELLSLTV